MDITSIIILSACFIGGMVVLVTVGKNAMKFDDEQQH